MFIRQLPLWLAQTNCWIISRSKDDLECILVDVPPSPDEIIDTLRSHDLKPVAILATHGHIDHVGGIATIARTKLLAETAGQLPVYINNADKHLLLDPVGTSGALGQELLDSGIDVTPPELIYDLEDGDVFKGSGLVFETLHTPGHTEGSLCFLARDADSSERVLFSGDHLFKGSIGRTDLPGGSYAKLVESMKSRILPLDDALIVLPGHGGSTTIGVEKSSNPFLLNM